MKVLDILIRQRRLQERNEFLSRRLGQMTRARDEWRAKAIARSRENKQLRRKLARRPLPRPAFTGVKSSYSAREWQEHDLILKRIRAL